MEEKRLSLIDDMFCVHIDRILDAAVCVRLLEVKALYMIEGEPVCNVLTVENECFCTHLNNLFNSRPVAVKAADDYNERVWKRH